MNTKFWTLEQLYIIFLKGINYIKISNLNAALKAADKYEKDFDVFLPFYPNTNLFTKYS